MEVQPGLPPLSPLLALGASLAGEEEFREVPDTALYTPLPGVLDP